MSANAVPAEEIKTILTMGRQKKPVILIMEKTGRCKQTIYKILRRHGVPVSRERISNSLEYKREMQAVIRRIERGETLRTIAESLGVSQSTISQRLDAYYRKEEEEKYYGLMIQPQNDPRSIVCQQIQTCADKRCHMHEKCPAYRNFIKKYHKRGD